MTPGERARAFVDELLIPREVDAELGRITPEDAAWDWTGNRIAPTIVGTPRPTSWANAGVSRKPPERRVF